MARSYQKAEWFVHSAKRKSLQVERATKGARDMTKEELQEYHWLMQNVDRLEEQLFELETKATRMTSRISDEPRCGSGPDKISDLVSNIIELKDRINSELGRAYATASRIEMAIETLSEKEKHLIRSRYLDRKSWEVICVEMSYVWSHVHRIHAEALKKLKTDKNETQ